MHKLTLAMLAAMVILTEGARAIEPLPPVGVRREVIATPQGVGGLRFVSQSYNPPQSYMVRTGNLDGGDGAYNGCPMPCMSCSGDVCADWTLMPWYGPWPDCATCRPRHARRANYPGY